jgi:hypothetical protein
MAFALAVMTSACSKEDANNSNTNNNQTPAASLEQTVPGTWDVTKIEQKNGVANFGGIQMNYSGVGKNINVTFTCNADGTLNSKGSYTMDVTMTFMGQTIPQSESLTFDNDGTWSVKNGKLVFAQDGEAPVEYDVLSRTNSKLELKSRVQTEQEFQGQTVVSNVDLYLTLEK